MLKNSITKGFLILRFFLIPVMIIGLFSCSIKNDENNKEEKDANNNSAYSEKNYSVEVLDEGEIIFYSSEDFYRYGPSIMEYDDGSMDAWFSSPGNSGSQWDWITYRHYDGENWSSERVVLKPTPGSKDQCSVCDPGLFYFDGYYYLAYTGTDYYEGKGTSNSAFVARSEYPDGPFEKWNGESWGGSPEPIIAYEDDPAGWGIGEVSFVVLDEDLYIYYTYADISGAYINLCKADLVENWPATIRFKDQVLVREHQDSLDVVYDEKNDTFFAFSIFQRMSEKSRLIMYVSKNGKAFEKADTSKDYIEDFAHNIGVAKNPLGHINVNDELLIGYAYGENWGRWNTRFQHIKIHD